MGFHVAEDCSRGPETKLAAAEFMRCAFIAAQGTPGTILPYGLSYRWVCFSGQMQKRDYPIGTVGECDSLHNVPTTPKSASPRAAPVPSPLLLWGRFSGPAARTREQQLNGRSRHRQNRRSQPCGDFLDLHGACCTRPELIRQPRRLIPALRHRRGNPLVYLSGTLCLTDLS